jgi:uncharacterized protein (DUF58 family)
MQLSSFQVPPRGAHTRLEDLLALRFAAASLSLKRKNRALSLLAGPNKSNFRGRGIDFEEVRRYQAGDDIRTIDWRVTARTGDAHTKLFREERERPVLLVVDQRNSMYFGSSHCFKSVLAAHGCALLAWSALHSGDRVGGLVFNDAGHMDTRPRRSRKTVLHLLSRLVEYNNNLPLSAPDQARGFADMLANLRRIARPGSSIFLLSDFRGAEQPLANEQLFQLAQHTEITALYCQDALETELPASGRYAVTDGSQRSELYTGDRTLRRQYRERQARRIGTLNTNLQQLGIPLIQLATDQSPFATLQLYYGGPRKGGPRKGGPRQGGPRQGGPRQGGPREGGPREGGPREGGPRR